jgi:anti-sigma factor RsiW
MTADACVEWREDIGALAVGQLEHERHDALVAHLETCPACRVEADELRTVAALVPLADVDHLSELSAASEPGPPPQLATEIFARVAAERRRRRRVVWLAGSGIAALAAAALVVALVAGPSPQLHGEQLATAAFVTRPPGSSVEAVLAPAAPGTEVALKATGLHPGTVYALWLGQADGSKVAAGTFRADADGKVDTDLMSALPRSRAVKLWATDPGGTTILLAPLA